MAVEAQRHQMNRKLVGSGAPTPAPTPATPTPAPPPAAPTPAACNDDTAMKMLTDQIAKLNNTNAQKGAAFMSCTALKAACQKSISDTLKDPLVVAAAKLATVDLDSMTKDPAVAKILGTQGAMKVSAMCCKTCPAPTTP